MKDAFVRAATAAAAASLIPAAFVAALGRHGFYISSCAFCQPGPHGRRCPACLVGRLEHDSRTKRRVPCRPHDLALRAQVPAFMADGCVVAVELRDPRVLSMSGALLTDEAADDPRLELERLCAGAEVIDFSCNELTRVPAALLAALAASPSTLREVRLGHNRLREVPARLFELCASSLRGLELQFNALEALPVEIGRCAQLDSLRLDHNPLCALPAAALGGLTSLVSLHLGGCDRLRRLPEEIGACAALQDLIVPSSLAALPPSLARCEALASVCGPEGSEHYMPANVSKAAWEGGAAAIRKELAEQLVPPVAHLVFLRLRPEADAASLFASLRGLKAVIPGLYSVTGGPNMSLEGLSRGYSHAFCMFFANAAARDAYLPHPAHETVKALVLAAIEPDGVAVFDYNLPPAFGFGADL